MKVTTRENWWVRWKPILENAFEKLPPQSFLALNVKKLNIIFKLSKKWDGTVLNKALLWMI